MKNLFNSSILALFCFLGFFLTSCEQSEEMAQALSPQFSSSDCPGVTTEDIDLTEGFRGTFSRTPSGDGEFTFDNHDAVYPLNAGNTSTCDGVCAFRVEFEAATRQTSLDVTQLQISSFVLSYEDNNNTLVTNLAASYTWAYPYLDVYDVYTNAEVNYSLMFANNMGSQVTVKDVVVTGGLCVIDNVNHTDPIKHVDMALHIDD